MNQIKTIDGHLNAADLKFAILATRFNDFIVDRLVGGAVDYLIRHGGSEENLTIVRVPGAFEMPLACKKLAASGKYDGIVAVGAVIRGGTPHFDFVAAEATKGLAHVSLESGVPVGFGLLTTDNIEQAIERAGTKAGNKGVEAASAVLETVRVLQQILVRYAGGAHKNASRAFPPRSFCLAGRPCGGNFAVRSPLPKNTGRCSPYKAASPR